MFCAHGVCVAWTHLRLTNLELAVHVGIESVVPISQPERNSLLWSVQFVEAARLVRVWVVLLSHLLGEGFDDGPFVGVRGVSVPLVQLTSFPGKSM